MKVTCLFALVLAAAAQDGSGSDTQAQGTDSYGEQAESYGAESYGEESYGAAPAYVAPTPKCCVSFCPDHSPFFSLASCACHAGIQSYEPQYSHVESYAQPTESYGQQEQSSDYRQLEFTQPDNTIDTRRNVLNKAGSVILWIVFGLLFLSALYYIRLYSHYAAVAAGEISLEEDINPSAAIKLDHTIFHFVANPTLVAGLVCLIASLAYLTMATGNGWYQRCCDGRMFFFARYIDWVITTPLMIHALCHYADAGLDLWQYLFFMDILMIVSGLIASTICNGVKWVFFAFSMLAFLPILYYLCELRDKILDNTPVDAKSGKKVDVANPHVYLPYLWFFNTYGFIANLTVTTWFLYPIVWILAEGTGKLSVSGEAIFYAILDFIAKGVFGYFVSNPEIHNVEQIKAYSNALKYPKNDEWK